MANLVANVIRAEGITDMPLFSLDENNEKYFDFAKVIPAPQGYKSFELADWCRQNWGSYRVYESEVLDKNTVRVITGWTVPENIVVELSRKYPDVLFEIWWAWDYVSADAGHASYQNGVQTFVEYDEPDSEGVSEHYNNCWYTFNL